MSPITIARLSYVESLCWRFAGWYDRNHPTRAKACQQSILCVCDRHTCPAYDGSIRAFHAYMKRELKWRKDGHLYAR